MSNLRAEFNKTLAKNREKYHDATQKMKKNYEQDLQTIREQNDDRIVKIKQTNHRKVDDINDQSEIKLKRMGNKLKQDQEYQSRVYRNKINEKTKDFNDQRIVANSKYKRQINDISSAYDKSLNENERLNRNNLDRIKTNFDFRIKQLQNDSDARHYEITEKSDDSIKSLNREFAEHKKDLLRSNDEKNRSIVRRATDRENKLKDGFNQKYSELNKIHQEEQKRTDEKVEAIVDEARQRGNKDAEELIFNYRKMLKNESDKGIDQEKNLLHDKKMALAKQKRDYDKQLLGQKLKMNTLMKDGLGEHQEQVAAQERRFDEKLGLVNRRNDEFYQKYNRTTDELSSGYNDSLDELNREKTEILNQQNNDFKTRFTDFQNSAEEKMDKNSQMSEARFNNLKSEKDSELMTQDKSFNLMINRQRDNFNKTISHMSEENEKAYEELYKDFNNEKDEIKKMGAKNLADTTEENNRKFSEKLRMTVENFENKIRYMENKHQEQVSELNENIEKMEKEYHTQLKLLKEFEADKRREEKNNLMDTLHHTKRNLQAENQEQREQFTKKLDQTEQDHEREMANLKRLHTEEVSQNNIRNKKKMNEQSSRLQKVHSDFVYESKLEKEMLIKNYEQKIEDMKRYYETSIADLKLLNEQHQRKSQSMNA